MNSPLIIIAIIFKDLCTDFIRETIYNCLKINYRNYFIYLFPDSEIDLSIKNKKIKIFPTGKTSIPKKRNMAIKQIPNNTDFIAFIDADASPEKNWLKNAIRHFSNSKIVAVGGPNLTPANESMIRKISGFVMQQKISFGSGAVRHNVCASRYVAELPTCNLILKSSYAKQNLFKEAYLNAEDMKYCSDIIAQGYEIFYAEDVIVYHHRKKIILPLAHQFYNYGFYRCKSFLNTPLGSKHFMLPTFFLLYIVTLNILGLFFNPIAIILIGSLLFYFFICFFSSLLLTKNIIYSLFTSFAIFICHVSYGFGFLLYYLKAKIKLLLYGEVIRDDNKNKC